MGVVVMIVAAIGVAYGGVWRRFIATTGSSTGAEQLDDGHQCVSVWLQYIINTLFQIISSHLAIKKTTRGLILIYIED
jgi:hypothetical protein